MLLVQHGPRLGGVIDVQLNSCDRRTIYQIPSKIASDIDVVDIQCSARGHEATIALMGSGFLPLYVNSSGKVEEISVDKTMCWCLTTGVAIVKPGWVAVLSRRSAESPDRVIEVPVRP